MTNGLALIKSLGTSTPRPKREKLKSRRQRRQEMRDAIKSAKPNQKKIG